MYCDFSQESLQTWNQFAFAYHDTYENGDLELDTLRSTLEETGAFGLEEQEIIKSLSGESEFTQEVLAKLIADSEEKTPLLSSQVEQLQNELTQGQIRTEENTEKLKELVSWADIFDTCSPEQKKMIVSHMLNRVLVGRPHKDEDYSIFCEFYLRINHSFVQSSKLAKKDL